MKKALITNVMQIFEKSNFKVTDNKQRNCDMTAIMVAAIINRS